ncbi:MAG TPA: FAD-linked oxidase C-terminal domain-containing protein [Symbiobacteriaceae bacterium]|jgi:glycolate oxidase subunit GlcD
MQHIFAELTDLLGRERVRRDLRDRLAYAYDATGEKHLPDLVVFPETTAEVAACLRLAREHGMPVIPRGAGTNLSGGTLPLDGGMVVNLVRLNRIRHIDPDARTALVETGVVNGALQQAAAPHGLFFAPDPSSFKVATLGGNLAENAGGPRCAKYGVTANHVLGVELVLADGTVVELGGSVEDAPGLDLLGLAIGSEGTLGIMTAATLRLTPLPAAYRTMMAVFDSLPNAMAAVSGIVAARIIPAALELLDENTMSAVRRSNPAVAFTGAALLLIEVDGEPAELDAQVSRIDEVVRRHGAGEVRLAGSEAERNALWAARRAAYPSLAQVSPSVWAMDVTVPRDRLVPMLNEVLRLSALHGLKVYTVAHAGDGNMHPTIPYTPEDRPRLDLLNRDIQAACVALGGSITGEHGVGIEKLSGMGVQYGSDVLTWMQAVRQVFDPDRILNPGKAVPGGGNPHDHSP